MRNNFGDIFEVSDCCYDVVLYDGAGEPLCGLCNSACGIVHLEQSKSSYEAEFYNEEFEDFDNPPFFDDDWNECSCGRDITQCDCVIGGDCDDSIPGGYWTK